MAKSDNAGCHQDEPIATVQIAAMMRQGSDGLLLRFVKKPSAQNEEVEGGYFQTNALRFAPFAIAVEIHFEPGSCSAPAL
jgi:hypothetical protein